MIVDCHTHHIAKDSIINADISSFNPILGFFYSVGLHPWNSNNFSETDFNLISEIANDESVIAIGETGVDRLRGASEALQEEMFTRHVLLSEIVKKPLILHVVKSIDTILSIKNSLKPQQPWIWHGFRGNPHQMQQIISMGISISFGEHFNPESAKFIPKQYLLIETDCSKFPINEIANKIAKARNENPGAILQMASANLQQILKR